MLHCNRLLVFHHRIFSNNDETLANDFNALEVDGDPFFPVMLGFYFDEGAMSTTRSAIIPFIMFILNVTGTCFVPIHLVHKGNEMNGDKAGSCHIQDKHDERNNRILWCSLHLRRNKNQA